MSDVGVNFVTPELPEGAPKNNGRSTISDGDTVGAILTRAREAREWSVQQVADQLKLSAKQIGALEANQFDALPKMVIVRGFVRTYAKLLKIDADALVAMLPREIADVPLQRALRPALSTPFLESRLSLAGHQESNKKYFVGAVFFAVFAAIFFLIQKTDLIPVFKDWLGVDVSSVQPIKVEGAVVAAPIIQHESPAQSLPVAINTASSASIVPETAVTSALVDQKPQLPAQTSQAASMPTVVAPQSASVASANLPSPAILPTPVDGNTLRLKFRQDSWIQVKKESGVIVTSHLAKAGTEEFFSVTEPLQVRIGNAAGVDGVLRGAALIVAADKGSNVANLNVK